MREKLRVYLSDQITGLDNFMVKIPDRGRSTESYWVSGIEIECEDGRFFVTINENGKVPVVVAELVVEFSIFTGINFTTWNGMRKSGIYRLNSAQAEVELQSGLAGGMDGDGTGHSSILIKARTKDDALGLLHRIKIGTILPDESYETPQGGQSRAELMAKVEKLYEINERLCNEEDNADRIHVAVIRAEGVCNDLRNGWWPFCRKARIVAKIETALRIPCEIG